MLLCAHCGLPFDETNSDAVHFATYCSYECEQLAAESANDENDPEREEDDEDPT